MPPSSATDYPSLNTSVAEKDIDALAAALTLDHVKALVAEKVSTPVVYYLVHRVFYAVDRGLSRSGSSHPGSSSRRNSSDTVQAQQQFAHFVMDLIRRAEVSMSVILGTLVYIERALPFLSIAIPSEFLTVLSSL